MLAVTGIGMVSSLGLDVATACAAARAGMQRIAPIDDIFTAGAGREPPSPLVGHVVPLIAHGFFGLARLFQLGLAGLRDLRRNLPDLDDPRTRLGFVLLVGSSVYRDAQINRERSKPEPDLETIDEQARGLADLNDQIVRHLMDRLAAGAGLRMEPAAKVTLRATAVGLAPAVRKAIEWMQAGVCDRCIIGAVDSLVEASTLGALADLGLLKTPTHPVGMIPGEAAVFFTVEEDRTARSRECRIEATIEGTGSAAGPRHPALVPGDDSGSRDGLAAAVTQALAGGQSEKWNGMLLPNLNGDEHRAQAWWSFLLQTRTTPADLNALPAWFPCLAFGDAGATSGGLALAMAVRGWARGYAAAPQALLCMQDDVGGRAAVAVRAPELKG
jgi:3-oxoacyl-[acyl-carrier-protein] synthase-1